MAALTGRPRRGFQSPRRLAARVTLPRLDGPVVLGVVGLALVLGVWQLLAETGTLDPVIISSPSRVVVALVRQWQSGELGTALRASGFEFGMALGLAVVVGVLLGLAMFSSRLVEYAVDPFVWFVYTAPIVAIYPVFILWFGLGHSTAIATGFLLGVIPIVVNTKAGLDSVDQGLVRAARSFGAGRLFEIRNVTVPHSLPVLMAGLRLAVGRVLIGVIVGEMFSANQGFGYLVTYYGGFLRTTDVLVSLLVLVILGIAMTQVVRWAEQRLGRWRPELDGSGS